MIKELVLYTVVCDNCGDDINKDADYCAWNDKQFTQEIADEAGWIKEDDKHYCPNCFSYDDDDNLIIKDLSTVA